MQGYKELKLKIVDDGDNEMIIVSKKMNKGDFDFFFVIRLAYIEEYCSDANFKYTVDILAVSPEQAESQCRNYINNDMGGNYDESDDIQRVLALVEYGCYATLYSKEGNNKEKLLKAAKEETTMINFITFGFAMDKYQNRIGSTGWDFIKGDIMAGLNKNNLAKI